MRIAVSGSIATDHLMTFAGKFTDTLLADKLDKISVSFLVGNLEIRRGGVAGNISYGLGCLGLKPLLVGCVGPAVSGRSRRRRRTRSRWGCRS
jgi:adenosine kinase